LELKPGVRDLARRASSPVQLSIDLLGQIKKTNLNLCLEKVAVVAIKASAQTSA
jgi:hypothetical protein